MTSTTSLESVLKMRLAVLLALAAVVAGCGRSDQAVRTAVTSQLAADPVTASLQLEITVTQGVVHLMGETNTGTQQQRAVEVARAVKGVKDVVNEMRISDAVITAAVKQALAADEVTKTAPIDVDSARGHVRLMSDDTNRDQRQRAMELASGIEGVTNVEDRMK